MKFYAILISSAIAMAFATGYMALSLRGSILFDVDQEETLAVQKQFREQVAPHRIIDFRSLYYLPDQFQLIDPSYTLARFQTRENIASNIGQVGCEYSRFSVGHFDYATQKEWLWEEYRCGRIKRLPQNFFLQTPYMHSKGYSYVYLALLSKRKIFTRSKWVMQNIPLFHVTELEAIAKLYGPIEGDFGILQKLSRVSLWGLVRGENSLISSDYYFLKTKDAPSNYGLVYRIYKRKHLEDFLSQKNYKVDEFRRSAVCVYRDGQVCWRVSAPKISDVMKMSSFYVFLFALLIVCIVLGFIFTRIRRDRQEDEKKKLALRILAHEFRTPVAHLMLIAEEFNKRIDELPGEAQELSLKLSNSVHRLRRLTEMSQKYIRVENDNKLIRLNKRKIESVNEFFLDFLFPYEDEVSIELLKEDCSFSFDPYWISMCIKNLVDNALVHGAAPIILKLSKKDAQLAISVQDGGDCNFKSFEEMSSAFVKGGESEGMGLGLNIVQKIVDDMGAVLEFTAQPTTFKLILKEDV